MCVEWGGPVLRFLPNSKNYNMALTLRNRQHICFIYDENRHNDDLGTDFARIKGGAVISKLSTFLSFPKLGPRGGSSNHRFSQILINPHHPGEGV